MSSPSQDSWPTARGRQGPLTENGSSTPHPLADERAAEAEALAVAGREGRLADRAAHQASLARQAIEAAQRREHAEQLAVDEARRRAAAEQEAESAIARQAHAERLAEMALRNRIEAEQKALADSQRREFAAAELSKAAALRARKEEELLSLVRERLAADRHAADLAAERMRDDQLAEAAALARIAADREAARESKRRVTLEAAAAQAATYRREAEGEAEALSPGWAPQPPPANPTVVVVTGDLEDQKPRISALLPQGMPSEERPKPPGDVPGLGKVTGGSTASHRDLPAQDSGNRETSGQAAVASAATASQTATPEAPQALPPFNRTAATERMVTTQGLSGRRLWLIAASIALAGAVLGYLAGSTVPRPLATIMADGDTLKLKLAPLLAKPPHLPPRQRIDGR